MLLNFMQIDNYKSTWNLQFSVILNLSIGKTALHDLYSHGGNYCVGNRNLGHLLDTVHPSGSRLHIKTRFDDFNSALVYEYHILSCQHNVCEIVCIEESVKRRMKPFLSAFIIASVEYCIIVGASTRLI